MSETTEREHQGAEVEPAEVAPAEVAPAEVAPAEVAPAETRVAASRRVAAYLLLLAVLGCVAAMSWSGLYGWALTALHWSPGHAALVPISLDVAAMVCALLALDSLAKGEAATMLRALTAAFVALSAFINW